MVTVGALSIERCSEEAADANNTSLVTTSEANLTSQNYTIFDYMSAGAGNICLDILLVFEPASFNKKILSFFSELTLPN